ncbi:hypothetical protein RT717_03885 [Imperialibacter roseus]|uniref:PH domain-containing protein n=1 Tax=Imperialibacter roseus TaxID=1324217 RepID=A0ABZ0ITM6_9BACT|nr:hypothetical protein [Imperialibacter roseus]WOK07764.1 hypothetical protein RT717_03885 [Imperialibacter roseus]
MTQKYSINRTATYKSLKYWRHLLSSAPLVIILAAPFAHYIKGMDWDTAKVVGPISALVGYAIIGAVPTLIMHLVHYFSNRGVQIIVDQESACVTFRREIEFTYSFDDLTVTQHSSLYQENKRRIPTSWSNYSFLQVRTSDNKEFNISSIIMSMDEFPVKPLNYSYSFWPAMADWCIHHDYNRNKLLTVWKDRFSKLTIEQIESQLKEGNRLEQLPKQALEELLAEKKLLTQQ